MNLRQPEAYPLSKNEICTLLLECSTYELNSFIKDDLAGWEFSGIVTKARDMGLEPLTLNSLQEALTALKGGEK